MRYLTIGTSELTREKFVDIEDTRPDSLKPSGGLWLTVYNEEYNSYNEWVDYLLEQNMQLHEYKSYKEHYSMWRPPCTLIELKDNAKIFVLDSKEKLDELRGNYPLPDDKFSYKDLSKAYDGIFIDMYKLMRGMTDRNLENKIDKFSVNSLILFNLDCIEYYQSGVVEIDSECYSPYEGAPYEIKIESTKKRVLEK